MEKEQILHAVLLNKVMITVLVLMVMLALTSHPGLFDVHSLPTPPL